MCLVEVLISREGEFLSGILCAFGVLLMGHSGLRIAQRPAESLGVHQDRDVPYTSELVADVFHPNADGPWPTAVVLHGGEDHRSTMAPFGERVAEHGVVVFVPEWRSFPAQLEEHRLAAMEDVACAIGFARDRAREYGGDGERIVMAGWSLGGNFAAIAALRDAPVEVTCIGGGDTGGCIAGVVGLDGAYDFTEILLMDPRTRSLPWSADEMNELSALSYVCATGGVDRPVFRLFSGREEQLESQAARFRNDLEQAGFDVELVQHPGLSHEEVILAPGTVDALVDLAYR